MPTKAPDQPPFSDSDAQVNGEVPGVSEGVQQAPGMEAEQNIDLPQYKEIINHKLIDEINDKITQIDPKIFQGIVAELAELIETFKGNLSQLQMLQFTAPSTYECLLSIFQTLTTLAQIMLINSDLPTDQDVVSQQIAQQIQQVAGDQAADSSPPEGEDNSPDGRNVQPVGTIKWVKTANGVMRPRVKQADGTWKYSSRGQGGTPGRPTGG